MGSAQGDHARAAGHFFEGSDAFLECPSDLIVLDADHPQLFGHKGSTLIDSLIFSGNNNPVCHVMCGGSWVVRDKVHSDEAKIAADFRSTISRLMSEPL